MQLFSPKTGFYSLETLFFGPSWQTAEWDYDNVTSAAMLLSIKIGQELNMQNSSLDVLSSRG